MAVDGRVRWGVVGAGGFADTRAMPALAAAPNATLQAVMVRDRDRAEALARKHNARAAYDSIEALLADDQVDAVYICTPDDLHLAHTEAAAAAGKHVLCEKPMARSTEECLQMIGACERAGVRLGVAHMVRFRVQCRLARQLIDEGRFGQIVEVRAQSAFGQPGFAGAWRQEPGRGGGALWDLSSHAVDTLRYLAGDASDAVGIAGRSHFGYKLPDTVAALLRFDNEAMGFAEGTWAVPNRECPLEITGTEATLMVRRGLGGFTDPQAILIDAKGTHELPLVWQDEYTRQFEAFSRAVQDGAQFEVDGWAGLRVCEILTAVERSLQTGRGRASRTHAAP